MFRVTPSNNMLDYWEVGDFINLCWFVDYG